jgi:hypothetical protein
MAGGGPASRRASFPTARPTVAASRADGQTRTTSVLGCSPRAPGRWSSQSVPGRMRASTNHRSPQMCRQGRAASISSGVKRCTTGTPHVIDGDARSVSGSSDISVRPFFPRQRRADRERPTEVSGQRGWGQHGGQREHHRHLANCFDAARAGTPPLAGGEHSQSDEPERPGDREEAGHRREYATGLTIPD